MVRVFLIFLLLARSIDTGLARKETKIFNGVSYNVTYITFRPSHYLSKSCPFCTPDQRKCPEWSDYESWVFMRRKQWNQSALAHFCSMNASDPVFQDFSEPFWFRYPNFRRRGLQPLAVPPKDARVRPTSRFSSLWKTQRWLYRYQNPPSCEDRKFLILEHHYAGFGSILHGVSWGLTFALNSDRILLFRKPLYWSPGSFGLEYYFRPISNCSVDLELHCAKADLENIPAHLQDERCVTMGISGEFQNLKQIPKVFQPNHDTAWWRSQSFLYTMRRVQPHIFNYVRYHRAKHRIAVDTDTICMHVRQSDKTTLMEMMPVPLASYVDAAKQVMKENGWKRAKVFVTTESQEVIDRLKAVSEFDVLFYPELRRNEDHHATGNRYSLEYVVLLSLINLSYHLQCRVFIGTRLSNWSRIIDRLKALIHSPRFNYSFIDLNHVSYEDRPYLWL